MNGRINERGKGGEKARRQKQRNTGTNESRDERTLEQEGDGKG
jgi:hypothetical protein